ITPTHKTSTTHSAITDQAGLSHINTENFNQPEVQDELNQIIANDFDKEQALKELNAQTVITTEFGREAPKVVADFADNQAFKLIQKLDELNDENIDITSDEYQNTIKEIDKWGEGGIYRIALHTATAALATGTIEGTVSAGTTAYTIPKIDEYLTKQGFDENTRQTALLTLSATLGATIGDSTASTINNVGQVQWNYLYHESALRSGKLTPAQLEHVLALKRAGAVSYETLEKKYNACKDDACRDAVKNEWHRESERTKNIQLQLVERGILTWEDFDSFANDGYIGVNSPHLETIQNKRHTLAAMELSSWSSTQTPPARIEALRRDGGVTPGSTEDLLMQVGAGTVGAMAVGSGRKSVNPSRSNSQNQRDLDPVLKNGYIFKHGVDIDLRNTGKTQKDALDLAFQKTGVSRSEFSVTKWAKDKNGKSFPVEYRVLSGKNRGAEVNIDMGHTKPGTPGSPHIGWQTPGKNNIVGHIFVDKVDVYRVR
ncbi:polymorphic toxin type 47 domain-containing protein, partial [Moraxella sp. Tifton1]|uniref:polymorphic toxin type 47 domain-containing protein n=1 Tax=Moraxella oculi TaxID=2940516 RepID=UPI0020131FD8